MFRRTTTIAVALATLAIPCASADAVTKAEKKQNAEIKKLTHDVKVLSGRLKSAQGFISCLQYVNLTQYGAADGTFGYMYDNDVADATSIPFATTGIDVAQEGDGYSSVVIIDPSCGARSSRARAFGPMIPPGTMAYAIRKGD